jgi:hypothetical protein
MVRRKPVNVRFGSKADIRNPRAMVIRVDGLVPN